MKRTLLLALAGTLILVSACRKKGCTDEDADNYDPAAEKDDGSCYFEPLPDWQSEVVINDSTYIQLSGTIDEDFTLTADGHWLLSGSVFVDDGVTLTIEEGTTIYAANDGTTPFLSILPGATIEACGSAASPIVFTSIKSSPQPGDWGGLILNGFGVVNTGTGTGTSGTGTYGGGSNDDNSGSLCYVRVEYAGKSDISAFTFNACGSGTEVNHLQAYKCSKDGFEINGGKINLPYIVSSGSQRTSINWDLGWQGLGQFWVVEQSSEGGRDGIYGFSNDADNTLTPVSAPKISNVTMIGKEDGDGNNQGVLLSDGTKCELYNFIVTGFSKRGVQVDGDSCISYMTTGSLRFQNSIIDNTYPFKFTASSGMDTVTVNMLDDSSYDNETATNGSLVGFLNGYLGVSTDAPLNPTTIGSWFSAAVYAGAVEETNDWTSGWTKDL